MAQDSNVFITSVDPKVLDAVSQHAVVLALDRIKASLDRLTLAIQANNGGSSTS